MKKLLTLLLLLSIASPSYSETILAQEQIIKEEHLFVDKKATTNKVIITNMRNVICKGNKFKIAFDCKFHSEKSKAGDKISFSFPESIYTREGTFIIPANTKIIATVINIEKPKKFNKNAKVYLRYDCIILPNCDGLSINAKTCTKDGTLKEGPWMTAGKLAASTVGLGAIGAGAGLIKRTADKGEEVVIPSNSHLLFYGNNPFTFLPFIYILIIYILRAE